MVTVDRIVARGRLVAVTLAVALLVALTIRFSPD
jgi:hypothetical protein